MLSTTFLHKTFSNPLILASGIQGLSASNMLKMVERGAGGVTMKSVSVEPRGGHANPTMIGTEHFFLNAVGLSNPGLEAAIEEIKLFKKKTAAPLVGSIFAGSVEEFGVMAERMNEAPIDCLEINVSCPNVKREFGTPYAYSVDAVENITRIVKKKSRAPVIIKLSPNAWNIVEIAQAAESAGADALTAVNTVGGMAIDIRSKTPILHNKQGGVSGPALFPIALKCVYDIFATVKIPIIGTGGVTTGADALAMIMAGATLLGIGSAVYYRGQDAFAKIAEEMEEIMREEGIKNLGEIKGVAHKYYAN